MKPKLFQRITSLLLVLALCFQLSPSILAAVINDGNGRISVTGQDGDVIESRFAVERRNRTIHKRMREYLFELTHNEGLLTSVVPLGDGIAITMKSHEKREETT